MKGLAGVSPVDPIADLHVIRAAAVHSKDALEPQARGGGSAGTSGCAAGHGWAAVPRQTSMWAGHSYRWQQLLTRPLLMRLSLAMCS